MDKEQINDIQQKLRDSKFDINCRTSAHSIKGAYYEFLAKELLYKIIRKYKIGTGLIQKDPKIKSAVSKQCDIIIYDDTIMNYFEAGDIVIVPPESVKAVIEVKATTPCGYRKILDGIFGPIKKMNPKIKCYYWVFNTNESKKDLEKLDNLDATVRISNYTNKKPTIYPDELYNFLVQLKNDLKI